MLVSCVSKILITSFEVKILFTVHLQLYNVDVEVFECVVDYRNYLSRRTNTGGSGAKYCSSSGSS